MEREDDLHYHRRRFKRITERLESSGLSEKNKNILLGFQKQCLAEGLGIPRVKKYLQHLLKICSWMDKDLESAGKDDLVSLVQRIEGMGYSEWTKHDYKVALKKFYRWLNGGKEPERVRWMKITVKNQRRKLPEELLTEGEVEDMIRAADHPRDRALVSLLYESGARIGELASLKVKHIFFDRYGAKIVVKGKTGMRRLRIISSSPRLASWLEVHPNGDDPEAHLWVGIGTRNKNKLLSHNSISHLLSRLAKSAEIKKRVHPHLFRHSRATHLSRHLTEAQMNQIFGWVQGSDMPSTYIHMSGRDTDDALLKLHGLKRESDEDEEKFKSSSCPRCETINPPGAKLCNRCGMAQDMEAAMEIDDKRKRQDDVMSRLLEDDEVKSLLVRKIREHGLSGKLES